MTISKVKNILFSILRQLNTKKYQNLILMTISFIMSIAITEFLSPLFLKKSYFCVRYSEANFRDELGKSFINSDIPGLYFEPRPNSPIFNSLGLRDREYGISKDDNMFRIIVLGDSVSECKEDIPDGKFYHEILEEELNRNSKINYQIWNASARTYNTLQEYLYFKNRFLQYKPDLVILQYLEINDFDPPRLRKNQKYKFAKDFELAMVPKLIHFSNSVHNFLLKSNFYKLFQIGVYNLMNKLNPVKFPNIYFKSNDFMEAMEANKKALYQLIELSKQNNFKLLIVIFPLLDDSPDVHDRWIRTLSVKQDNVVILDLLPIFKAKKESLKLLLCLKTDVFHPNEEGHKIASDAILNALIENNWVFMKNMN